MKLDFTLTAQHIEYCDALACRRRAAAIARNRPPGNGAPVERLAALQFDILGTRTECVGYLYLKPIKWHTFCDEIHNLPDLDDFIDVKGRSKDWYGLPIQKDDPESWAYLLITAERHPVYQIVGWCWGHEGKQSRFWPGPKLDRPAFFVPQDDLIIKPADELFDIVRRKQTGGAKPVARSAGNG
jgi:hypothetical protein